MPAVSCYEMLQTAPKTNLVSSIVGNSLVVIPAFSLKSSNISTSLIKFLLSQERKTSKMIETLFTDGLFQ